ncbi:MAG: DUF2950 family protein [Proteobacteria bacterium]|nr:DUF2950 family protein [Pseudomonadota bacterium]
MMTSPRVHPIRSLHAAIVAASLALLLGCAHAPAEPGAERFDTPEAAAAALLEALEQKAPDALLDIVGHQYRDELVTADWDYEHEERLRIVAASREQLELSKDGDDKVLMLLGPDGWPLPLPIVREGTSWRFDMDAGLTEMIDRRVGRNELAAIALLGAYVDAQIDYARVDRNGDEVLEYAQRLVSSEGQRDGLYWPSEGEDAESPFGPLVEGAESYLETTEPGDPFFGYYLRILTKQGPNPPGGRYDYVINGHMIAGFALAAYPAEYGVTGVMTFVVNHGSKIHEKDIGAFAEVSEYDPDDTWHVVED